MAVTSDKESKVRRSAPPQMAQSASDVSYYASRSLSGAADVNRAPQAETEPVQAPPAHQPEEGAERTGHDISRLPITTDARDESRLAADTKQAPADEKDGAKPAPEDAKPQSEPSVAATTDETQTTDKQDDQTVARSAAPEPEAEEDVAAMPNAQPDAPEQEQQEQKV